MWKRKRTLKEEYGTLGHFLRGDNDCHYLGDLYIEGTNFYHHREWRGVRDTAYAFARWLQTWVKMAGLIGRDPVRMVRAFWKYRWLSAYLATPMMVDKWIEGDRGMVLRADLTAIDCMVSDSITTLWREIRADRRFGETKWTERTIAFDYTLPKHIIYGFPGYFGINIQQHAAFMVPILNKNLGSYYVDQAVSCGIPGDMCTLPLVETGVAVEGEYPDIGNCWLTTNNPCDANMMDNVAMYRALSSDGKKAAHVRRPDLQGARRARGVRGHPLPRGSVPAAVQLGHVHPAHRKHQPVQPRGDRALGRLCQDEQRRAQPRVSGPVPHLLLPAGRQRVLPQGLAQDHAHL